jgi:hypothetical protein
VLQGTLGSSVLVCESVRNFLTAGHANHELYARQVQVKVIDYY